MRTKNFSGRLTFGGSMRSPIGLVYGWFALGSTRSIPPIPVTMASLEPNIFKWPGRVRPSKGRLTCSPPVVTKFRKGPLIKTEGVESGSHATRSKAQWGL